MQNEKADRPAWMNDTQYAYYCELRTISDKMFDALIAGDLETWRKLRVRLRDMTKVADDYMVIAGS
jgi:hypothetical protein